MSADQPTLVNLETNEEIRAASVPERMQQMQQTNWTHGANQRFASGRSDFMGTGPSRFAFEMRFLPEPDGKTNDVRPQVQQLVQLCKDGANGSPPTCMFSWGSVSSPVVVDDVRVEYGRFIGGVPTEARVGILLTEMRDKPTLQAVASQPAAFVRAFTTDVRTQVAAVRATVNQVQADVKKKKARIEKSVKATREAIKDVKEKTEARIKEVKEDTEAMVDEVKSEIAKVEKDFEKVKAIAEGAIEELLKLPEKLKDCVEGKAQGFRKIVDGIRTNLKNSFEQEKEKCESILKETRADSVNTKNKLNSDIKSLQEKANALATESKNLGDTPGNTEAVKQKAKDVSEAYEECVKTYREFSKRFDENRDAVQSSIKKVAAMPEQFVTRLDQSMREFAQGLDGCKADFENGVREHGEPFSDDRLLQDFRKSIEEGFGRCIKAVDHWHAGLVTTLKKCNWDERKIKQFKDGTAGHRPAWFDAWFEDLKSGSERLKSNLLKWDKKTEQEIKELATRTTKYIRELQTRLGKFSDAEFKTLWPDWDLSDLESDVSNLVKEFEEFSFEELYKRFYDEYVSPVKKEIEGFKESLKL